MALLALDKDLNQQFFHGIETNEGTENIDTNRFKSIITTFVEDVIEGVDTSRQGMIEEDNISINYKKNLNTLSLKFNETFTLNENQGVVSLSMKIIWLTFLSRCICGAALEENPMRFSGSLSEFIGILNWNLESNRILIIMGAVDVWNLMIPHDRYVIPNDLKNIRFIANTTADNRRDRINNILFNLTDNEKGNSSGSSQLTPTAQSNRPQNAQAPPLRQNTQALPLRQNAQAQVR